MAEDALRLREELAQLKKDIENSKHIKEVMDQRIQDLHAEEIKYLEEIPSYKKRAEDAKQTYMKLDAQNLPLKQELQKMVNELAKVRGLVVEEEKALRETREAGHSIEKDITIKKTDILKREEFLKIRESSVQEREKEQSSKDSFHKKIENDLDKKEVEINNKQQALNQDHKDLNYMLELHNSNLSTHAENVCSLAEQRSFLEEDKLVIKDKLTKASNLVSEHIELKQQLLLQADKASKAIQAAEDKQKMLYKALDELQHQENSIKIKDLKIRKMAHDAGLQKELKELEESLK